MYKVMIIDDEPIIVKGLSQVVKWESYGCEIVGSASDGLEGLEMIRKLKPDIIFSDIAMPGMDGLKMIAALRVEHPDMMITILTGYRDFEFAQQAIRLGVNRFLLKPSNMSEIEEAVVSMTEALKKKNGNIGNSENAGPVEAEKEEGKAGSFIVNDALQYIAENDAQKMSLNEVAEKTYVSQWHLSKLLNKHTGKSFSDILNQTRIENAKKLLQDPSLRIGDIAELVGFLDVAHFSRVFKKQAGISANEYRNRQ